MTYTTSISGEIDPRTRRLLLPTRIIWCTEGDNAPRGAEVLLTSATSQATVAAGPRCVLPPGGAILLDFGQELHGGVQIVIGNTGNGGTVAVRLRFGESVSEAMGEPNQEHALHDHTVRLPRWGAYEVGNTGYRFVRIDVLEACNIELIAVRAIELMRDLPYRGRFNCSDPQLNAIWQVAARTVHLCMQDYLWDGIKRDRLVWVGDMHPESQVISHLFGADPIVPRSLDYVRDETPPTGWMNGISSYTLWWVIIMHDWYRFHGDLGYLEENRGYLRELLPHICTQVDESGQEALSEWRFLDWGSVGQTEAIHAGLHALLILALEAGGELCTVLQDAELAAQCQQVVQHLRGYTPALLPENKQSASLLVLAGVVDPITANQTVLSRDPLCGISPFYGYYILRARAQAGDIDGCLTLLRRYWGGMLKAGATSFWEHFDVAWLADAGRIDELPLAGKHDIHAEYGEHCYIGLRHSLCHGWAAGPVAWLSEYVLGIQPVAPGCRTVRITPNIGDLEYAEGAFPTPYGDIVVHHARQADGTVASTVEAPPEVTIQY